MMTTTVIYTGELLEGPHGRHDQEVFRIRFRSADVDHIDEDRGVAIGSRQVKAQRVALPWRRDLRDHSQTGLSWGYPGSGPSQLALAILADALDEEEDALRLYMIFKDSVIANLPQDEPWAMDRNVVRVLARALDRKLASEERLARRPTIVDAKSDREV